MSHINRGDIHAYLDGALGAYSEEAAKHVREHLDVCGECARLLNDEKRIREEASMILSTSAAGPVELNPLEELLARAEEPVGPEPVEGIDRPERTGSSRPSWVRRMYGLRWAATVVVSLGAGWLTRDLSGPARDVAREIGAVSDLSEVNGRRSPEQVRVQVERDAAEPLLEEEVETPAAALRLAEVESPPPPSNSDADVNARLDEAVTPLDSRGARVSEEARSTSDPSGARDADDVALDQIRAVSARQRAQSNVASGAASPSVDVTGQTAEARLERAAFSDGLQDAPAGRPGNVAAFGNAALEPSPAPLSTIPFLIPGLPVRGVRLAASAEIPDGRAAASVIVTQELDDGRFIELQFVALVEDDPVVGGTSPELSDLLSSPRPAGWRVALRTVAGGVAVLSGPLTEPELVDLLDLVLAPR
jgi:hypothetical protein